jgi:cytidylate kinase
MSIVAISSTLGSWGDEIGRTLGRRLGWEVADREIIAKAAERFGEGVLDLTHVTEGMPSLLERFTDTRQRYRTYVEAIVLELAARDNVVLGGRGAVILLRDLRHVLRVRITAPEGVRAARLENEQGLTHEAAIDVVRESDRERAARVRFLYQLDWDDACQYDLVLNTERLTVERGAVHIEHALADERFRTTPDARRMVAELSAAAAARATRLAQPPA